MKVYTFYSWQSKKTVKIKASSLLEAFQQCPKLFSWVLLDVKPYIGQEVLI